MPPVLDPTDVTLGRHKLIIGDGVFANIDTSQNTTLRGSAALAPGTYTFRIITKGASGVDVFLKPTAYSGTAGSVTCRLYKLALDLATQRGANANPDVALASGTMTKLSINDLRGEDGVYLEIVVPAGSSITFGATAIAESLAL